LSYHKNDWARNKNQPADADGVRASSRSISYGGSREWGVERGEMSNVGGGSGKYAGADNTVQGQQKRKY